MAFAPCITLHLRCQTSLAIWLPTYPGPPRGPYGAHHTLLRILPPLIALLSPANLATCLFNLKIIFEEVKKHLKLKNPCRGQDSLCSTAHFLFITSP